MFKKLLLPTFVATLLVAGCQDVKRDSELDLQSELRQATQRNNFKKIRLLVSRGADVNATDRFGRTPLHWAAEEGHLATVKSLIAAGANSEAKDECASTPLWLAVNEGHLAVAQFLIDRGRISTQKITSVKQPCTGQFIEMMRRP